MTFSREVESRSNFLFLPIESSQVVWGAYFFLCVVCFVSDIAAELPKEKKKEKRCWKFWQLGIWTRSWLFQALSRHVLPPAASLTRCQRMPCLINTVCKGCWRGHRALLIKRKRAFQSRCILMKGKVSLVCSMGMGKPHMWILPWMLDLCGFHHT